MGSVMAPTRPKSRHSLWRSLRVTAEMIKFEHSVFALPFALLGALLAARGWPTRHQVLWIVVAMVGARSAAMSFNRLIDRHLDAGNPRTANRALPTGTLSISVCLPFSYLKVHDHDLAITSTFIASLGAFRI